MREDVVDRVRLVRSVGRYRALHKHRRRRIRSKYIGVMMFDRTVVADLQECLGELRRLQQAGVRFSRRGERRIARLLNKAGHRVRAVTHA